MVVEDEVRLARHISRALTTAGHDALVVHDGESALRERAAKLGFDLIVLDVMLPGIDGFEVLRRLRKAHVDSRVLILTARGELNDRVNGLALGADDYLAKPFAMQELVARVGALGRRYAEKPAVKFRWPISRSISPIIELMRGESHASSSPRASSPCSGS